MSHHAIRDNGDRMDNWKRRYVIGKYEWYYLFITVLIVGPFRERSGDEDELWRDRSFHDNEPVSVLCPLIETVKCRRFDKWLLGFLTLSGFNFYSFRFR